MFSAPWAPGRVSAMWHVNDINRVSFTVKALDTSPPPNFHSKVWYSAQTARIPIHENVDSVFGSRNQFFNYQVIDVATNSFQFRKGRDYAKAYGTAAGSGFHN